MLLTAPLLIDAANPLSLLTPRDSTNTGLTPPPDRPSAPSHLKLLTDTALAPSATGGLYARCKISLVVQSTFPTWLPPSHHHLARSAFRRDSNFLPHIRLQDPFRRVTDLVAAITFYFSMHCRTHAPLTRPLSYAAPLIAHRLHSCRGSTALLDSLDSSPSRLPPLAVSHLRSAPRSPSFQPAPLPTRM